ncbi:MAG: TetR/AcrR family transcriptional regulator [Desulfosudaceae bacterium]
MKASQRKQHILLCAKKLFSSCGFYRTQISDIIKEARIARGTIYQYFENKQDIFVTLLENTYLQWEKAISEAVRGIDLRTITPEKYLRLRVRTTLAFLVADPDICNIVMTMGFGLPAELEMATRRLEEKIRIIAINDFQLGIHNGHIRRDLNVEHVGEMIAGAIFRSAYYALSQPAQPGHPVDVETLTDDFVALFAPGIFHSR